jgi:ABC-type branched-subunit amino acid transport system permease subunit
VWFGGTGGAEDLMIYGLLIVLISVYWPGGVISLLRRLAAR